MTEHDYNVVSQLVRQRSGLVLGPDKQYLVESRLAPLVRDGQFGSLAALVARLGDPSSNGLATEVVEAMANNETFFWRDLRPFEALRDHVLPELLQRCAQQRTLSLWSAGCSSGQEVYSLAMVLKEHFPPGPEWKLRLIASDFSRDMLARARQGRFSQIEVNRGLPAAMLVKYFRQEGMKWQIAEGLRDLVEFLPVNLIGPWPPLPPMNVIFLRNVLIYMDDETKKTVLGKAAGLLKPDGYLVLGGAETTLHLVDFFERVEFGKAVYYRVRRGSTVTQK
jgi:chemotaxis protein methyltransferase CheR